MNITQLRINGNIIEGLDESSIKISVNNLSPVTMSGDSVAFSATLKAPRTPANDATFKGMNKGLYTCQFYDAELTVRTVPLVIAGVNSSKFYARVSSNGKEYSISLVQNAEKWSETEIPLPKSGDRYTRSIAGSSTTFVYNLRVMLGDNFAGFTEKFPLINPIKDSGAAVSEPEKFEPTIMCSGGIVNWGDNVATGSAELVPMDAVKGRGGYTYTGKPRLSLNAINFNRYKSYFPSTGSEVAYARLEFSEQPYILIEFPDGVPSPIPILGIYGDVTTSTKANYFDFQVAGRIRNTNIVRYLIPNLLVYNMPSSINVHTMNNYYTIRRQDGASANIKFPDGYEPDAVFQGRKGSLVFVDTGKPNLDTIQNAVTGFPYEDGKKLIDDFCTALQWRKIFNNGSLSLENVVHEDIRDKTDNMYTRIIDWSDKFVSLDGAEVPDEFGDTLRVKLGNAIFNVPLDAGTLTPIKDAFSSGVPLQGYPFQKPLFCLTKAFKSPSNNTDEVLYVGDVFNSILQRYYTLFSPRVQVKIKARLNLHDIEGLKLNYAYYFSQLGGYFYLKSLGEYDVSKGDCKLTLYKLNLS